MARQLLSLQMVAPGSNGLNKQAANALLGPEWATIAENCVIDDAGRIAARKGWADATTTPISGDHDIEVAHEYLKADGTSTIISAANEDIFSGVSSFSDLTGSLTPAASNWQFMNLEDKVIGVQQGETPILYNGTGTFADIVPTSGSLPTGNCGVAAFGRLWIADADKKTIKHTALLDPLDWGNAGSGTLLMENVWDVDEIVGIAAAFGRLIVFGKRNIVIWADAIGSTVGLDPANLYVEDWIQGTGLVARDSIQLIGEGDLLWLGPHGVQSMKRLIETKNNPIAGVTDNIRDYLQGYVDAETGNIRSAYDTVNGHYVLLFPTQNRQIVLNTKRPLEDGTLRVTEWTISGMKSLVYDTTATLYFGFDGEYGKYQGNSDDTSSFFFNYRTGWLDMGPEVAGFLKIIKSWKTILFVEAASSISFTIYTDFSLTGVTKTASILGDSSAEWGNSDTESDSFAEWGLAEWSGGLALRQIAKNFGKTAQYIQLGVSATIQTKLSIQQMNLIAKQGKMVI